MTLVLLDERGRKHLAAGSGEMIEIRGVGTFDAQRLQASVGRTLRVGTKSFLVLTASGPDLQETLSRGPQTISSKDLSALLFYADIVPGSKVVEAGVGSGALTVALARAVGPGGRVLGLDLKEDSLATARRNLENASVPTLVELRTGDVRDRLAERDLDAVVLDIPDPWAAVPTVWEALRPCGFLATFSPNMEQVKETTAAIRKKPFVDVRTIELIEREMEVRDVGMRPSFAALGHTGYLTFSRKVLDTF